MRYEKRLRTCDGAARQIRPEQKTRLAEIDRVYKGKIAEREIFLRKQLDEMLSDQKFEEVEKIRKQLGSERTRLEEEREEEKEKARKGFSSAKK